MVDFIITDFESVRGGGNIIDTVPSAEDFIVDGCTVSSSSVGVFVLTPGASGVASVSLSVSPLSVTVGGSVVLTATVLDDEDDPLEDVLVSFYRSGTVIGSDTSDSSGVASFTATMSSVGSFTLTAAAGGVSSSGVTVTVSDVTPVVTSVSLTADKSILSAYDSESAVLSATVLDDSSNPMEGETVTFYKGSTSIGTATTNSSGIATKSYSATGVGDVTFKATSSNIESSTVTVEDCWNTKLTEQTITCTSSSKYTSVGLDTIHNIKDDNFVLEFDSKGNGTLSVGHSSYWGSSTNYRATLGTADAKHYYSTRSTSTSESYGETYSSDTYYHYKLTREGSTIKFYVDGTLLGTKAASFFSSYTTWCIYSIIWGANTSQTIKNIKIKLL